MWDTSQDYRLQVAEKSIELFLRTIEGRNFKGHWNKKMARDTAHEMARELKYLSYSYMEPEAIAKSPQIVALEEQAHFIIKYMGGEKWKVKFLDQATRAEKEKLEENIAKVSFFFNTILGLKKRIMLGKIKDPIIGIDIKVGEIMSVSKHPQADNLIICNVNLGDKSITVVTNDMEVQESNRVAVSMLPPSTFMGITSDGMFLGAG
ncbi:MAG: tRNA-binding protein, partial [Euryarchaeota archaeon]|nr:tRNA-binding protein [Euryarchaeota archaeon]MBV1768020.1 tRNA-binding protein [Methanobacterium sp.]